MIIRNRKKSEFSLKIIYMVIQTFIALPYHTKTLFFPFHKQHLLGYTNLDQEFRKGFVKKKEKEREKN